MLDTQQAAQLTRDTLQLLFDQHQIPLDALVISQADLEVVKRGYGNQQLRWDQFTERYLHDPQRFELCLKLNQALPGRYQPPSGLVLCYYEAQTQLLQIDMLQNFVSHDLFHPLSRKMSLYTVLAAYLFMSAVGGKKLRLLDPRNKKLTNYYVEYFPFRHDEYGLSLEANYSALTRWLQRRMFLILNKPNIIPRGIK